jgi:uncharacterized protein YegL
MRRLPIYFLLDVSDSMVGEPRRLLETGIEKIVARLRSDPHALETAHVAVIAFAGRARQLVPMTDLIGFTPPVLPIGSGTSLGLALEELMEAIKREVAATTGEKKGDWKPLVYILTDGKPTDGYEATFERWNRDFSGKANVMGVGLGEYAATNVLEQICEQVFTYNGQSEQEFDGLVRWITNSIASVSESPGKVDLTKAVSISFDENGLALAPAGSTVRQDQDCVLLVGRCQKTKKPFLVKYDRARGIDETNKLDFSVPIASKEIFQFSGSHVIDDSYFEWSAEFEQGAPSVRSDQLQGPFSCAHCNANYGGRCSCGNNMCLDEGQVDMTCPWCDTQGSFGESDGGFDVLRSSG